MSWGRTGVNAVPFEALQLAEVQHAFQQVPQAIEMINSRGSDKVLHMSRSSKVANESARQGMSMSVAVSGNMSICAHSDGHSHSHLHMSLGQDKVSAHTPNADEASQSTCSRI